MPDKSNPRPPRPFEARTLAELLEISAKLQAHSADLTEETKVLVEQIREKLAILQDRMHRKD